jgi:hypothetical protein
MFTEKKLAIFIAVIMIVGVTTALANNIVESVLAVTMQPGNQTGGNTTSSGTTGNVTSGNITSSNTSTSMTK